MATPPFAEHVPEAGGAEGPAPPGPGRAPLPDALDAGTLEGLDLSEEATGIAHRIYGELLPLLRAEQESDLSSQGSDDDRFANIWRACVLFIAKSLAAHQAQGSGARNGGLPLTKILRATGAKLFDFFKELPAVVVKLRPRLTGIFGEDKSLEQTLSVKQWQMSIVFLTVIAKKYKELYAKVFSVNPELDGDLSSMPSFQFGWLLVLHAKARLLPRLFPDLLNCYHRLICVVNFLMINTPRSKWNKEPNSPINIQLSQQQGPFNTLRALAGISMMKDVDEIDKIEVAMKEVDELIEGLLDSCPGVCDSKRDVYPDSASLVPSCQYYEGLLEMGPLFNDCLALLNVKYEELYESVGEIDEREFIVEGFLPKPGSQALAQTSPISLMPSAQFQVPLSPFRPTGQMAAILQSPNPIRASPMPPLGLGLAGPRIPPPTPMSQTITSTQWLNEFVDNNNGKPSDRLLSYFKTCSRDVGPDIERRVWELAAKVFGDAGAAATAVPQQGWTGHGECSVLAVKVYYKVLEALLVAEEQRTHKKNFTSLLTSESFHQCLLACSAEIVVDTRQMSSHAFPEVLKRLGLKAFDFSKVIELFVKNTPNLPKHLKRHLFEVEEQIIECLAWEPGSSIYNLIRGAVANESPSTSGSQPPETPQTPPNPHPRGAIPSGSYVHPFPPSSVPSLSLSPNSAFKIFTSPLRSVRGESANPAESVSSQLQASTSPLPRRLGGPGHGPPPARPNPARTVLGDFFRKVLKLSALRLMDLRQHLCFDPLSANDVLHQVFNAIQFALYECTELFYNRHLDQILLSSLYGVCKVNQLEHVPFREIIHQYKRQPHAKPEVYKTVILQQSEPDFKVERTGDIIEFYNQVLVPALRNHLLATVNAGRDATAVNGTGTPVRRGAAVPGARSVVHSREEWPMPAHPMTPLGGREAGMVPASNGQVDAGSVGSMGQGAQPARVAGGGGGGKRLEGKDSGRHVGGDGGVKFEPEDFASGPLTPATSRDLQMPDAVGLAPTTAMVAESMNDVTVPSLKKLRMSESMEEFPDDSEDSDGAPADGDDDYQTEETGLRNDNDEDADGESMTE
ncbi:unnamed protein product [Ostreobium quekettii]|uniref:Uncharacterized protein n=1 Tax=Ostreobium quekettii TaxID=121088 RepID=A0A8S1JEJ7_9CHLO|nr:unnamed protein product [Ostreobium quekettii]|eukprot:evm.model.scf_812.7 EVM.evm.TU.scf_812.7   scf_812:48102-61123(+)